MSSALTAWVRHARDRTVALAEAIPEGQLLGPRLAIVNPPLWELGHVAWFQERWVLRHATGAPSVLPGADALYDSAAVAHESRWSLALPELAATVAYLREVERRVLDLLASGQADPYFVQLGVLHEDMHLEAMLFSRHTLAEPEPRLPGAEPVDAGGGDLPGDVALPGGTFLVGATPDEPFVFDNEKWAHPVELAPFRIARAPVTQARFAEFVDDAGYARKALWSEAGWRWREAGGIGGPAGWERRAGGWARRTFDRWAPLEPHQPMVNVSAFEAEAYCRWAGRRLPTEAEWEAAAAGEPGPDGRLSARKRRFPWGDAPPGPARAHVDARALHPIDVGALPAGDSAFGCRQLIGNVWEWTATDFAPYPGFVPDPYREYSEPWFGTHRVLRGGSFATPGRLLRNTWRNFYCPDRRDPWAGFRTCAA